MISIRWPIASVLSLSLCVLLAVTGCKDGISGAFCEDDSDCRASQQCVGASCVSVCFGVEVGDGTDGSLCTTDRNCNSLQCDNDRRTSTCTCDDCIPDFTDIGGTPENPVIWEEKYTCIDDFTNDCFAGGASDNNTPITFALVQDGKNITGTVQAGPGQGDVFEGELCGDKFQWVDVTPGVVDPEQGCWTFTSDAFNKRSYVNGDFVCVGAGTRGAGSTPPDVISCQDLGANQPTFSDCPPAPPAPPEQRPF